jgi:acetyl esterase/lipase
MLYDSSYIGQADPKDPYLSPVFGDFKGFPPVLMQVGSYEVLLSDTLMVADKLKKTGVKRRISVYEGMFHVFQMGLDLIPESQEAWEEVEDFLRIVFHLQVKPDGKIVRKVKTENKRSVKDVSRLLIAMMRKELDT